MPKKGKPLPGNGGKDSDDESESSVDSHGNLRDLIDYGSDSEEPSPRPIRKAALLARKKIDLIMKKSRKADKAERAERAEKEEKATHILNTIHYPMIKRRPFIPVSPSSTEEIEEIDEETEDEIDIEETDEEAEIEETEMEETESNEDENEELFRYILKMGHLMKYYHMSLMDEIHNVYT
jgi:hypothetical protein